MFSTSFYGILVIGERGEKYIPRHPAKSANPRFWILFLARFFSGVRVGVRSVVGSSGLGLGLGLGPGVGLSLLFLCYRLGRCS